MRKTILFTIALVTLLAVLLSACGLLAGADNDGIDSQGAQQTAVMQTVSAMMTQQAFETLIAQATQIAHQQATPTPQLETPAPTQPQNTPVLPTSTQPLPTWTPTQKPVPCNAIEFVRDVSVPDGSEFSSGQKFTKTWRLKNAGSCTWTKDYALVFVDGAGMSAPSSVALKSDVRPGETVDVSVELVAPSKAGVHKGNWMLRDASGRMFGLGANQDKSFWVSIKVSGYKSDDVPSAQFPLDFVASICQAEWASNAGKVARPCANISTNEPQWAAVLMNPKIEGDRQENERGLWMHLASPNDWMQGFYPVRNIKKGDHFTAWLACLDGNSACEVQFSLDYRIDNGSIQNLGKWSEMLDGKWTQVDLDLSSFEGKNVQLILGVTNKNNSGPVDVVWFVPAIQTK
ncbi:MAG: NBR1-Ig-like domain-containing protein [Chloroflexota bacterium]